MVIRELVAFYYIFVEKRIFLGKSFVYQEFRKYQTSFYLLEIKVQLDFLMFL